MDEVQNVAAQRVSVSSLSGRQLIRAHRKAEYRRLEGSAVEIDQDAIHVSLAGRALKGGRYETNAERSPFEVGRVCV